MMIEQTEKLKILQKSCYRGKHLILVAGKVFTAKTGKEALRVLKNIQNRYPHQRVTMTYVPKADTLIL